MSHKFPVHNLRKSINGIWQQEEKQYSTVIPDDGSFIVRLPEVPDDGSISGSNDVDIQGFTKTLSYPPQIGEFYVNYDNGYIGFNAGDAGTAIEIVYYGKGSSIDAHDINYLNEKYVISGDEPEPYHGKQWFDINTGISYVYDIRDKWLSINRSMLSFGRQGLTNNQYLNYYGGVLPSNNSGLRMIRNACITSLSGQASNLGTFTFHIRKNNLSDDLIVIDVYSDYGKGQEVDINLNSGDILQCYFSSAFSSTKDPMILIEISWRR